MWAAVRGNGDFFALAVRITGKLREVWQAPNCLFIHATFCVIACTGASTEQTENDGRGT